MRFTVNPNPNWGPEHSERHKAAKAKAQAPKPKAKKKATAAPKKAPAAGVPEA